MSPPQALFGTCIACATTWTMTRYDGPNHLGLCCDVLPEHQNGPNHLGLCVPQNCWVSNATQTLEAVVKDLKGWYKYPSARLTFCCTPLYL